MKRSGPLKRSVLKRRAKRRSDEEIAASVAWHEAVLRTGWLIVSEDNTVPAWNEQCQLHHIVYRQSCERRARELGLPKHVVAFDPRNGVPVTVRRHERIHSGHEPLRFAELSPERQDALRSFAAEFGFGVWLAKHLEGWSEAPAGSAL